MLSKTFFVVVPLLALAGSFDFISKGASSIFIAADSRPGSCNFTAIFNFGDSNSDTGGLVAGLGLHSLLPNGETFFNKPTGRYCNGRLVIDFLCAWTFYRFLASFLISRIWKSRLWLFVNEWIIGNAMNLTLLSPYLESVGSDFRHGSNFACAGSTVNQTATTFPLPVQVNQFIRFRARVVDIFSEGNLFISISIFHQHSFF